MFEVSGKTLAPGVAAGKIRLIAANEPAPNVGPGGEREEARLSAALAAAGAELASLEARMAEKDPGAAAIFGVHRMMLEDPDYTELLHGAIRDGASAEGAVRRAEDALARLFESSGDEMLASRAADVRDVARRLLSALSGKESAGGGQEPAVLVGEEVLPGDLLAGGALAVVTRRGSYYAHVSLLARSMGIPLLLCPDLDLSSLSERMTVLADGDGGRAVFDPDERALAALRRAGGAAEETPDVGKCPIPLLVNIASPADVQTDGFRMARGVGLYRTEYLYLGREDLPTEDEQTAAYASVLRAAGDRRVVIRTFDLGADKTAKALPVGKEENPALGLRGVRLALSRPDVFAVQLRALLRAATEGDLWVMVPMVTSVREVLDVRRMIGEEEAALCRNGIPHGAFRLGVMIETPAAVMLAEELAAVSDFFSVGTNDLSQYTMALDRQNGDLARFEDPENEAVLRLIRLAADGAHKRNVPIGVCGDLAADPKFAEKWAELGVDSLSVAPPALGTVAKALFARAARQ